MLTRQYCMHKLIMNWYPKELNDGKRRAHSNVASHDFDLENVTKSSASEVTLL